MLTLWVVSLSLSLCLCLGMTIGTIDRGGGFYLYDLDKNQVIIGDIAPDGRIFWTDTAPEHTRRDYDQRPVGEREFYGADDLGED